MTLSVNKPGIIVVACFMMFVQLLTGRTALAADHVNDNSKLIPVAKSSIKINRSVSSRKYRIRLYADTNQEAMLFSASGRKPKLYQLYLFDLGGKLISQASIAHKQTTLVRMQTKGTYLFEVFSDDERIESGEVLVN